MRFLLLFLLLQVPGFSRDYNQDLAQETFLHVWNKVNVSFYEESFNGVDWEKVKAKYEGKVAKAQSDKELRLILNQMLGELKLSHFGVSRGGNQVVVKKGGSYLGLELRMAKQQIFIFEVEQDSPADQAGLTPGMVLTSFEGDPMTELIEDLELTPDSTPLQRLVAIRSLLEKISAPLDGKTTLGIASSKRIFDFKPGFYKGERGRMGSSDQIPVSFETRLTGADNNIRVIAFDVFLPQLMVRINEAIAKAHSEKAAGLIIDLRGNPGGIGFMANGIIGRLVSEELDLGDMNNTAGNIPFHAFPQKGAYLGPIAVLVASFSASTSEIFAAALQEHQRARIFGRSTTAAVLPSVIEKLPNGDNFQYAVGDFVTALKKVHLEGKGVLPDEVIPLNTTLLLEGKDPDLEAALSWLKTQ